MKGEGIVAGNMDESMMITPENIGMSNAQYNQKGEMKMDKNEALKVLQAEREERVRACNAAIGAVLQEHRCQLVPQVVIRGQQIAASIAVVAEE